MTDDSLDTIRTQDSQTPVGAAQELPTQIGRFRILRLIGAGGFGSVYLAKDEQLDRQVAIKIPHARYVDSPAERALYLEEARTVARLEHPHIVPVLEVGSTNEFPIYIVSRYIVGRDLSTCLKQYNTRDGESLTAEQPWPQYDLVVRWLIDIADALHVAHQNGVVHRDIKPHNILVDDNLQVHLVDFGLAVRDGVSGPAGGTPAYMSPEQLRGEGHRIDGRSDLFSLGILFYELLCGRRPFSGESRLQLFEQIAERDPNPLREQIASIPAELERICMKLLAKRKSERYASARLLIDDLQAFQGDLGGVDRNALSSSASTAANATSRSALKNVPNTGLEGSGSHGSNTLRIVPKGLRSFDRRDSEFFLDLLPGTRNRFGLPESIAFWKSRIEERDSDHTFPVGLVYGPSGCGKSSMIKAGLLPRLDEDVVAIYIEASRDDTERTLGAAIRKRLESDAHLTTVLADAPTRADDFMIDDSALQSMSLVELLATIRRGGLLASNRKLLIIIDQFEQWLNSPSGRKGELSDALLQCDAARVQAIVMVRDDFWMAATRFFQELDIPLSEGINSASVDLFDLEHAQRVLKAFGRAFGKLEARDQDERQDRKQFVRLAAESLAENNKVISIRLALFAELMKGRVWTPQTLKELGGTIGVGAAFLEETFSSPSAAPEHRYHQEAARNVLHSLLPEPGSQIKGHTRSHDELLAVSGYQQRPRDFADLLRLLDRDLRLITAIDLEHGYTVGGDGSEATAGKSQSPRDVHYQLTHDYLIPSLRDWLTRKQAETRRGRAELRLAERANSWSARPESKQLPTLSEWWAIRWHTRPETWTAAQRKMMRVTDRLHLLVLAAILLGVMGLCVIAWRVDRVMANRQAKMEAAQLVERNQIEAKRLVDGLLSANSEQVPGLLAKLQRVIGYAKDDLAKIFATSNSSNERLHAALAMVVYEHPAGVDRGLVDFLRQRLLDVTPGQFGVVCQSLMPYAHEISDELWHFTADVSQPLQSRFQVGVALAQLDPFDERWNGPIRRLLASQLVEVNAIHLQAWRDALRNVALHVIDPLIDIVRDPQQSEIARRMAANVVLDFASDDPERLVTALTQCDFKSFEILLPALLKHKERAAAILSSALDSGAPSLPPNEQVQASHTAWPAADAQLCQQIEEASGWVSPRYAFCQRLPIEEFDNVTTKMSLSGYRPFRVRPYDISQNQKLAAGSQAILPVSTRQATRRYVAIIWCRDGRSWEAKFDLPIAALGEEHISSDGEPMVLADLSVTPCAEDDVRMCVLWESVVDDTERRQAIIDVDALGWNDAVRRLKRDEFQTQLTIHVRTNAEGIRRYSAIWSNLGPGSDMVLSSRFTDMMHKPVADIGLAALVHTPLEAGVRYQLQNYDRLPAAQRKKAASLEQKAWGHYYLNELEQSSAALEALMLASDGNGYTQSALRLRALLCARQSDTAGAESALEELTEKDISEAQLIGVRITVAAWLGEWSSVDKYLKRAEELFAYRGQDLIHIVRATAQCARAAADQPDRAERFVDQAVEWLDRCCALRSTEGVNIRQDMELFPLSEHPGFKRLVKQMVSSGPAGLLFRFDLNQEHQIVWSWLPSTDQIDRLSQVRKPVSAIEAPSLLSMESLRALADQGYQPKSIAVGTWQMGPAEESGNLVTAMVWKRPRPSTAVVEAEISRRAQAAMALLHVGAPDKVWATLQQPDNAALRNHLINRIVEYKVDPQLLLDRVTQEPVLETKRSIILALGRYATNGMLSSTQATELRAFLLPLYETHADAGLHSACRWTLQTLGQTDTVRKIDMRLPTPESKNMLNNGHWYVTKCNQHTLVRLTPPPTFIMGSPIEEPGRAGGAADNSESQLRRSIGRDYAIATCEVSVSQFLAFRNTYFADRGYARRGRAPANLVTWYDAAAYCNWLSEQEGIPRDQWCYEPSQRINEGLVLAPDYLRRCGYRLPTEAEWEYACRAGSSASRCYGWSEEFLKNYSRYAANSPGRQSWDCGSGMPNDFGLFDMYGNVLEWCQEPYLPYDYRRGFQDDHEFVIKLDNTVPHVARGGSMITEATGIRNAQRNLLQPNHRSSSVGFRIARTLKSGE